MCQQCDIILKLFDASKENPHDNYYHVLRLLEEMEEQKLVELIAGDCLLKDAAEVLASEKRYTVCHYLRCVSCETFYFIGACIRGTPVFKKAENIVSEDISKIIWGNVGLYYKN